MVKEEITVRLKGGINARPAANLVQVGSRFDSRIYVEADSRCMNAKSIMGMMALGLDNGEVVTITAEGSDEDEALKEIVDYLTNHRAS